VPRPAPAPRGHDKHQHNVVFHTMHNATLCTMLYPTLFTPGGRISSRYAKNLLLSAHRISLSMGWLGALIKSAGPSGLGSSNDDDSDGCLGDSTGRAGGGG
jgi:hypothetical protein